MTTDLKPFYELIYAGKEVEKIVVDRFPNANMTDASDEIHTERFECEIEGVTDDEFYPFAIREGFARCCLSFEILLTGLRFKEITPGKHAETKTKIEAWIAATKELN